MVPRGIFQISFPTVPAGIVHLVTWQLPKFHDAETCWLQAYTIGHIRMRVFLLVR